MLDLILIALMGMWLLDGVALLANPRGVIHMVEQFCDRQRDSLRWWGLSSLLGLPLLFLPGATPYRPLWLLVGTAMLAKGLFIGLAPAALRDRVLRWSLSREDVDYRFWGLGLCALAIILWHSLTVLSQDGSAP